jgi:hypothetical protein
VCCVFIVVPLPWGKNPLAVKIIIITTTTTLLIFILPVSWKCLLNEALLPRTEE